MIHYTLPINEATFAEVVKRKTNKLKDNLLHEYSIHDYANEDHNMEFFWRELKVELKPLINKTDKSIFISEQLIYMGEKREIIISEFSNDENSIKLIDDVVHYLFRELEKLNVGVDKNAFSVAEIKNITSKINAIIKKLDKLTIGQEVIFDRIDELKEDYKDILNSFGLGKKPFFQRFAGIVATYMGEKGADEAIIHLRPYIKEVFNDATKLIG